MLYLNEDSERDALRAIASRFWAKVVKSDECWERTGCRVGFGYGVLKIKNRPWQAHRVAWELVAGPIPDGLSVLHACDNPACVRNDDEGTYEVNGVAHPRRGHLWLGTHADNRADQVAKGRSLSGDRNPARTHPERLARGDQNGARLHPERLPRGERHGMTKLTDAQVREIRCHYAGAPATFTEIASSLGVHRSTIARIVKRTARKEVA